MIYVTEKQRFYSKTWLGAKRLDSVQAFVLQLTHPQPDPEVWCKLIQESTVIKGTLREYSVAGWKELLSGPDVYYRADANSEFAPLAGCNVKDWAK